MRRLAPIAAILITFLAACGSARPAASVSAAEQVKPAASAQPSAAKLQVSYSQVIVHYTPLWMADEAGIYTRDGLQVTQQPISSSTGTAALVSGQVQLNVGGGPELLGAAANGADLVALANLAPVEAFKFEVASSIQTKQDLIGKKVGTTHFGSNTDTSLRMLFRQIGIKPDVDVTFIQLDTAANIAAAMASGSIQGALVTPPQTLKLEASGAHPLYDFAQLKILGTDVVVSANRSWLNTHHDEAQRFIDSMVESLSRMRQDKQMTIALLKKYLKLDDVQALNEVYDYYVGSIFSKEPYITPEQFAPLMDVLTSQNPKIKDYDLNKLIDSSFVKSAVDRGLVSG